MRHMRISGIVAAVLVAASTTGHAAGTADPRLLAAAGDQQTATVKSLLAKGVDPNAKRADGVTALMLASHANDLTTADALLKAKADASAADDHGVTPLGLACENASGPMVDLLLAAKADPNAAQHNGLTPLMIAARTGDPAIVNALIKAGADVNATTAVTHEAALMWAVATQHRPIITALVAAGAKVNSMPGQSFSPLLRAARAGDIETATLLLDAGASLSDGGADGTNPLVYSMVFGQAKFAHFLLARGADANGTIEGTTALHVAAGDAENWLRSWNRRHGGGGPSYAEKGRLSLDDRLLLVQDLLARGANPNARTIAAEPIGGGFLRNGAFDNFTTGTGDSSGATPLWVAAYSLNGGGGLTGLRPANMVRSTTEIVRLLLKAGADPNVPTVDGTTPLMAAAGCGWWAYMPGKPRAEPRAQAQETVKILVEEAKVPVNVANEADFTPLHCAAYSGLNELVQYLVDHGANLNARDWRGRTPYRIAEGAKQAFQFQEWPATAELLKSLGADTTLGVPGTVQERLRAIDGQQ